MKAKKIVAVFLGAVLLFALLAGCSPEQEQEENGPGVQDAYYEKSLTLSGMIFEDFWLPQAKRMMAYVPEYISGDIDSDMSGTASLWAFGAAFTMTGTMLRLDPEYEVLRERAGMLLEGLEEYRMPRKDRVYSATVGLSEPYYDDNAWIALGLYDYAEAFGDEAYYEQARDVTDYVLSGESENGGIFWKESVSSRNTCSSGPAIVAALKEYEHSGEESYLQAAKRIYEWTSSVLRDPADNVYWDNATYSETTGQEQVVKSKFTYNSGTMIWAGVLLYEITGEESYLADAQATAEGALLYFASETPNGVTYFPSTPWFNLYLLQGYLALYGVDGETKYIEAFVENLDLAWEKGRDEDGYVMPNWGGGPVLDEYEYVSLLQEAATAECYALIAKYRLEKEHA